MRDMAKIPVIDVGTVRKISEGAIKVATAITEIVEDGAVFRNSERNEPFDAIILATGYRANYSEFLQTSAAAPGSEKARHSGIYFVGFRNWVTGLLREIGREATAAAADIARQRRGAH
jgi:cation diffusion facilitator CzcD-associated flavoprotein CzcO